MDSFEIFKKLSKGARFRTDRNSVLNKKLKKLENELKIEQISEKTFGNETVVQKLNHFTENTNIHDEFSYLSNSNKELMQKNNKRKCSEEELSRKKALLNIERINHYRNVHKIKVVGKNVPEPAYTFEDFHIDEDILKNIKKCGYTEPTPIQKQAVPILLKQSMQLLACAPTGSGKTAAFLVPIIQNLQEPDNKGFRAVILCPTRELAKQTQRECIRLSEGRNFRVHIISKIKKALEQYGPKSNKKFDILVTTPKRLCFLLDQKDLSMNLKNVEWLVVDEADKLFEEGENGFKKQLQQIKDACDNSNRKIVMFSATCTPTVSKWCVRNMKPLVRVTVGCKNSATDTVDQKLVFVGTEQGKLSAFRDLVHNGISPPVLVFVQSKERAQELFNELVYDGMNVDAIHADRTQIQRDNTVKAFREGKIWILICTELMARGVDFKGVNLVVNYDFPLSSISYIHRIGRAGRAGRKGSAITFFTKEDVSNLRSVAHILKQSGCEVPAYMLTLKKKRNEKKKGIVVPKRKSIRTMIKKQKTRKNGKEKAPPQD